MQVVPRECKWFQVDAGEFNLYTLSSTRLVVSLRLNEEQKIGQVPIISLTSERVRSKG